MTAKNRKNEKKALIHCHDLDLGYEGMSIVKGLDFTVRKGDYLCIVGENGSGKSTLVRTLLGLIRPLGGSIELFDGLTQRDIGYLPQHADVSRDFPASVLEVVLSGCQGRRKYGFFYNKEEKQRAVDSMERMDILPLADRSFRDLSGGQQQRVLLARALCAVQRVLILDEPIAGLDPHGAAEMYQLIYELYASGVTIIMISHDLGAALNYADHVLHIGKTAFYGTRKEYLESDLGKAAMAAERMDRQ